MYYEEQIIEGVLHWRSDPNGKWTPYTIAELSHRYDALAQRLAAVEGVCVGKPLFRKTNDMVSIEWPDGVDTALVSRPLIDQWVADYNSWHRTWTKEKPTAAGWYWYRATPAREHWEICRVTGKTDLTAHFIDGQVEPVSFVHGEWCRIQEPREPDGKEGRRNAPR